MSAPTLHQRVVEAIARGIVHKEVAEGSVISLSAIEAEFGVSRTVAREVMRKLEGLGLLQSRRKVGLVVQPKSQWRILDSSIVRLRLSGPDRLAHLNSLTELRLAIEPMAALLAARHATAVQRDRIVELANELEGHADDPTSSEYLDADIALHIQILEASGNELFGALGAALVSALTGRLDLGMMPHKPRPAAIASHVELAKQIRAADSRAAYITMATMLHELWDDLFEGRPPMNDAQTQP